MGIPARSWAALLRIVLGHPAPKHAGTLTGDGVLLRLLSGESVDALRDDTSLTQAICAAHPDKHAALQRSRTLECGNGGAPTYRHARTDRSGDGTMKTLTRWPDGALVRWVTGAG